MLEVIEKLKSTDNPEAYEQCIDSLVNDYESIALSKIKAALLDLLPPDKSQPVIEELNTRSSTLVTEEGLLVLAAIPVLFGPSVNTNKILSSENQQKIKDLFSAKNCEVSPLLWNYAALEGLPVSNYRHLMVCLHGKKPVQVFPEYLEPQPESELKQLRYLLLVFKAEFSDKEVNLNISVNPEKVKKTLCSIYGTNAIECLNIELVNNALSSGQIAFCKNSLEVVQAQIKRTTFTLKNTEWTLSSHRVSDDLAEIRIGIRQKYDQELVLGVFWRVPLDVYSSIKLNTQDSLKKEGALSYIEIPEMLEERGIAVQGIMLPSTKKSVTLVTPSTSAIH